MVTTKIDGVDQFHPDNLATHKRTPAQIFQDAFGHPVPTADEIEKQPEVLSSAVTALLDILNQYSSPIESCHWTIASDDQQAAGIVLVSPTIHRIQYNMPMHTPAYRISHLDDPRSFIYFERLFNTDSNESTLAMDTNLIIYLIDHGVPTSLQHFTTGHPRNTTQPADRLMATKPVIYDSTEQQMGRLATPTDLLNPGVVVNTNGVVRIYSGK